MVLTVTPPKPDQSEAADRLIRVNILNSVPTTVADTVEFGYDGFGRRVHIDEKHGSTVLTDKTYLWVGAGIAEERDTTGMTVSKRYFGRGFQIASGDNQGNYYYSKDHLGSIREVTNAAGAVVAKYDYDLWGRQTKLSGTMDADFGYTGFYMSRSTGLDLTWYRAYNPEMGRWLSRDPLKEKMGYNQYMYTNNPLRFVDPYGLQTGMPFDPGYNIAMNNYIVQPYIDAEKTIANTLSDAGKTVIMPIGNTIFDNPVGEFLDNTIGTVPPGQPNFGYPPVDESLEKYLDLKFLWDKFRDLMYKPPLDEHSACPTN
jgi:RHS repeat-associated protein